MFQDIIEYPLIIKLEFAFVDGFTEAKLREVKRLFSQSYYKKMIFSDHPERHYYVLLVDDSFLSHNTLNEGLVTLYFRNLFPYAVSSTYESPLYNFAINPFQKTYDTQSDWEECELTNLIIASDNLEIELPQTEGELLVNINLTP